MIEPLTPDEIEHLRGWITRALEVFPSSYPRERRLLATIDALTAERDELRLTLANERGEGAGPSDGWAYFPRPEVWARGVGSAWDIDRADAVVGLDGPGQWDWRVGRAEKRAPTARAAMIAADLALAPDFLDETIAAGGLAEKVDAALARRVKSR